MESRSCLSRLGRWMPQQGRSRAIFALGCLLALCVGTVGVIACVSQPAQQAAEVRTTLSATGFDPPEARRAPGRVRLVVINQSGQSARTLRLKRLGGSEVMHEGQLAAGVTEWSAEIDFEAGKYVLSEANNPAWLFYIIVE